MKAELTPEASGAPETAAKGRIINQWGEIACRRHGPREESPFYPMRGWRPMAEDDPGGGCIYCPRRGL